MGKGHTHLFSIIASINKESLPWIFVTSFLCVFCVLPLISGYQIYIIIIIFVLKFIFLVVPTQNIVVFKRDFKK